MLKYWKLVNPLVPGGKKGHTYLNKPTAITCMFV